MTAFTSQSYNMLLQTLLFNITPPPVGAAPNTIRGEIGKPENIPERCFIVGRVTAADGFPTSADRNKFNGFIDHANLYHSNFGFPITRIKSFWHLLDFYKAVNTDIGRIRIVTHGMFEWMQFPMFPGGNYNIGITDVSLDAFTKNDEEGLRWTLTTDKSKTPMLGDITSDIVDGMRKVNSALLIPLKINAAGAALTGDTKLFLDAVTDHYHIKFGAIITPGNAWLDATQLPRVTAGIDYIEAEIRKRLEGATLGTPPNTIVVSKQDLDTLKTKILDETPAKLELIGAKETLPADIMKPNTTPGSLAHAMAANPKVEDDLRIAISGGASNLMFSNRTGEILIALHTFYNSALTLSGGVVITDWASIQAVPDLEDYFFICNDLYMMKKGEFEITGGANIDTDGHRPTIRTGLFEISKIIKKKVKAGTPGISNARLNTLLNRIENLSWQESQSTNTFKTIPENNISQLHFAVGGLKTGFRANLNHIRGIMKNTSFVDIRGCRIGSAPIFMTNMRNFLGTDADIDAGIVANKPTISAPEWWQSFPPGYQYHGGTNVFNVFPKIDAMVQNGFAADHITGVDDVDTSFTLWRGLINFDPHFAFISALFAGSDAARFNFTTMEWNNWQVGGAGAGIPVLKMQAQRIDDITTLDIRDVLERFRLIFEITAANGVTAAQRTTLNDLRPFVIAFKALKASVIAAANPDAATISQFYNQLGTMGNDINNINGTTPPGTLLPPGAQTKVKLDTYVSNVETYIFTNLTALLGPFFTNVRAQLAHANAQIRYYCNIGLVLPIQSSSNPATTIPVVMISFANAGHRRRMFMDALRGWMKVQWKGSPAQAAALNAHIDGIPLPATLQAVGEFARRAVVSDGNPHNSPAGLPSHYCPLDEYNDEINTEP